MKISYDPQADAVYIQLREGQFVANREVAEGVILDMGEDGIALGIEILEASTRLSPGDVTRVPVLMPVERTTAPA